MDRFYLMSVYVAVAEEAGFSRAARRLGISPPAATRAVYTLERALGVKLLTRTTRRIRVTEAGSRYLEDARRILAERALAWRGGARCEALRACSHPRGELDPFALEALLENGGAASFAHGASRRSGARRRDPRTCASG